MKSEIAPAVSAAKPPTGVSLVIFEPIVWMMRQPPDNVPSAIAACAESTTQIGIGRCRVELQIAAGDQRAGDDPHRLLRVVAAVSEAVGGGRHQLQAAEPAIDAAWGGRVEDPQDARSSAQARGSCRSAAQAR